MLEVQRKCEKEPRKPHSDSDILKKARETEAESQTVVPNDEEEESTKTPKNSEKVDDFQRKHVEEIDEGSCNFISVHGHIRQYVLFQCKYYISGCPSQYLVLLP
jgi:hypothetical protein